MTRVMEVEDITFLYMLIVDSNTFESSWRKFIKRRAMALDKCGATKEPRRRE